MYYFQALPGKNYLCDFVRLLEPLLMRKQARKLFLVISAFILFLDVLTVTALRLDSILPPEPICYAAYGLVPLAFLFEIYRFARKFRTENPPLFFSGFFVLASIFLAFYLPRLLYVVFFLLEIAVKMLVYPVYYVLAENRPAFAEFMMAGPLNFISLIILPVSVLSFFAILLGMIFGRFNFRIHREEIQFPDLPAAFDGFRLVQISDLHLGSLFGHQDKILKAVGLINRESPDIIVFTGDLVNNLAEEAEGWTGILAKLLAGYGKFSILGNHDYGEYYPWPGEEIRLENRQKLCEAHREAGFELLLNRAVRISRGEQEIWLAGVENWGLPPFKQYGELESTLRTVPGNAFTILLSHDPSHWDAEILDQSHVQLTLSGHTHGMQFGLRLGKFRWSPIKWKYPRWIGLYRKGERYLYVNPGLGYIGYAGRILIPPEITVFTLRSSVQHQAFQDTRTDPDQQYSAPESAQVKGNGTST